MSKTGYYTHPLCWKHEMWPGHPECPERLDAIQERLLITGVDLGLTALEAPPASPKVLALSHDPVYVDHLHARAAQLREEQDAGGPTYSHIDADTLMNIHTWEAALVSAGAAVAATDAVIRGELANAFCAVRPPGHHASVREASGFCFFNNVAVAARYALEHHGLARVAVVDFDVHHGNGTEDILAGDERVLMVSIFQHPFYPHSGTDNPAPNMCNVPVPAYTRGPQVRELIEQLWLPRLEAFRPQMIFVSAGFDAHREDDMGQLGLTEADYTWITQRIREVALRHAQGRIVSCLEGGYALGALARSVEAHLRVLADI